MDGSWGILSIGEAERARTASFAARLGTARRPAALSLAVLGGIAAFAVGPAAVIPAFAVAVLFGFAGSGLMRGGRPELAVLAVLLATQGASVAYIALADAYQLDALALLMLPALTACLLFPRRLMQLSLGWSVVVMVATAFAVDPHRVLAEPPILLLPLGAMLAVAMPVAKVREFELASRATASIDTLTGALNRAALDLRLAELQREDTAMPLRVGAIMADVDFFKRINDDLGHEAGDRALRMVVGRLRTVLGPLTPVYRVGGEEFAVLMAGADDKQVSAVAERLRRAVRAVPIEGRAVTMSFGVAAGTLDREDVSEILERADQALYGAKRAGRDQVMPAVMEVMPAPAMSEPVAPSAAAHPAPTAVPNERASGAATAEHDAPAFAHDRGNWLVRGDFERDHIREHAVALNSTHHAAIGFIALALLASIPWLGWHLLIPALFAVPNYHVAERRIMRVRRPEYSLGGAWLLVQISIALGAAIVSQAEPYMLVLFLPMLGGITAVFPTRGVWLLSGTTMALLVIAGVTARSDLALHSPGVIAPIALVVIWLSLTSGAAGRASIEHRVRAVIDPLTGILTRASLRSRLDEVEHESQVPGARVSLIAIDVDGFKAINDTHGHALGDRVLKAVGGAIRQQLHALEWAFRLGGDEFLVVVPGGEREARLLAESIRETIAGLDVDGVEVTGSFGVAESSAGVRFDFEGVARRADAALYEAKRAGRNCVAVAPLPVIDGAPEPYVAMTPAAAR